MRSSVWNNICAACLGVVVAGCGTSAPTNIFDSIEVTGDANIGGTVHASNIAGNSPLDLLTNGASRLHIDDATGNVGIGTMSPVVRLHVAGDARVEGILAAQQFSGKNSLDLATAGLTRIWVDEATGFVGIGTGTTTPEQRLHVLGTGQFSRVKTNVLEAPAGSSLMLQAGGSTRIFIDDGATGYIGMGTFDPKSDLDVRGGIQTSTTYNGHVNSLEIRASGDVADLIYWSRIGNSASTSTKVRFALDTTWINGDTGFGRDPTTNRLEVSGDASKTTAGDWLANSDARIKTEVETVSTALETLDRVRLVSFRYSDEYRAANPEIRDQRYVNVIAQEFREVFPEYVRESNDKLAGGERILQVDTYPLTIYSAAAVQELHQALKRLESENASLREKLGALDARIAALEAK